MRCFNCIKQVGDNILFCPNCGCRLSDQNPLHCLPIGTVLHGRFEIGTVIGEGGFGITYIGYDETLHLKVAIKEFFPSGIATRNNTTSNSLTLTTSKHKDFYQRGKERFLNEARSIARFSHEEGTVDVRDFFTENDTAYIVMEYLDGVDLCKYLNQHGKMEVQQTFEMMLPLMRTLNKLHEAGVIHRDIAPDNIMRLDSGKLKLMDFGSARYFLSNETNTTAVLVKRGYSPYEQFRSKNEQGPWTDVYSLCATIYTCITGIIPSNSVDRNITDDLKKPSELGVDIPESLESLLMKGLAVLPTGRLKSMTELIRGVEKVRAERDLPVSPGKKGKSPDDGREKTVDANSIETGGTGKNVRRKMIIGISICACVALLAGVLVWKLFFQQPPVNTEPQTTTQEVSTESATEQPTEQVTEEPTQLDTDPPTDPPSATTKIVTGSFQDEGRELFRNIANMQFVNAASHTYTYLYIHENGSFSGTYRKHTVGIPGENYNSTDYVSSFTGHFTDVKRINDYSFSMTVSDVTLTTDTGKEEVIDNTRYVYSGYTGDLASGSEVTMYTPNMPFSVACEHLKLIKVGNNNMYSGKIRIEPDGDKLGYYSVDTGYNNTRYWLKMH